MARTCYIVSADTEVTDDVIAAAQAAGAGEVYQGVPPTLADLAEGLELPAVIEIPEPTAPSPDETPEAEQPTPAPLNTTPEDTLITAAGAAGTVPALRSAVVAYAEAVKARAEGNV